MQLGENIYQYRTAHNLSQGALADALEVSRQSVSKWENNSAVPELDKLLRMSALFNITLDELVHGRPPVTKESVPTIVPRHLSPRIVTGIIMMLFGMVFFLLSIFWGDHLRLGEEFGELLSISIVLLSISFTATYQWTIFSICTVVYLLYGLVCTGILKMNDPINDIFLFLAGITILVWFIVLGLHENKKSCSDPEL